MPQLPTITINDQAVWDRLLAVFGSDPVRYKKWLRAQLRCEVLRYEQEQEDARARNAKRGIFDNVATIRFDVDDDGEFN